MWALTVGKKTEMLATGGSDAVINLWHDSTAADREDEFRKEVMYLTSHFAQTFVLFFDKCHLN